MARARAATNRAASRGGNGRAGQFAVEAAAGAELQGEEGLALVFADLVDLYDVRVMQPGDGFRLGAEAGQVLGAGVAPARIILRATTRFRARCRAL